MKTKTMYQVRNMHRDTMKKIATLKTIDSSETIADLITKIVDGHIKNLDKKKMALFESLMKL